MSWNNCLYWYAQERGGRYFGLWPWGAFDSGTDGALVLDDPKGPLLAYTKVTSAGRYGVSRDVTVGTAVELERAYRLRIKPQSTLREGWNTVLDGLDRGARMLGKKVDLSPDYGVPELADDRGIKTSEPEFTRWVLRDRRLGELLDAHPDFWIQIGPAGPDSREHLVEARVSLDSHAGLMEEPLDRYGNSMDLEVQQALVPEGGFSELLDALTELAKAARDAVTAWPMPMKTP